MTNQSLARSYLVKAQKRLKALAVLRDEGAHSDVVREAQELVELALKGTLRAAGIEPPKFHDVGGLLIEHEAKFSPSSPQRNIRRLTPSAPMGRRPGWSPWQATSSSVFLRKHEAAYARG